MPDRPLIKIFAPLFSGALLIAFVFSYVDTEHPAYIWDRGAYFSMYQHLGSLVQNDIQMALDFVLKSVRADDYNVSSVALLMPVYLLVGPERFPYIFGTTTFFLIPAVFMALRLGVNTYKRPVSTAALLAALIFAALFPPFWQATLRGFPDIVGLIPLSIASLLLVKSEYLTKSTLRTAIAVGVLVWMAFMFRRWYAYACIALMVCAFFMALGVVWLRDRRVSGLFKILVPFTVATSAGVVLLCLFQFDLASRVVATSYSDIYQAYQAPITHQLKGYYGHAGLFSTLVLCAGVLISIRNGYRDVLFFVVVALITIVFFSTTQAPTIQHRLPVYLFLMPATLVPVFLFFSIPMAWFKKFVFVFWVVVVVAIYLVSFSPMFFRMLPYAVPLAPAITYHPIHLDNYSEYQRLIKDLHGYLVEKDTQFAVFASSEFLSDSLLRELDRTLETRLLWSTHVDERDGFNLVPLRARFAVVATPVPTHLPESSQKVIIEPAEMILSGVGIGSEYRVIAGPYALANNHQAFIYERTTPLSEASIRDFEAHMKIFYKEWRWDGRDKIGLP